MKRGSANYLNSIDSANYYCASNIRRNLSHFLLGRGITAIASFAVALLLINWLNVDSYGAFTALSGLVMVFITFSSGGLERVMPKFFPELRMANANRGVAHLSWLFFLLRIALILAVLLPLAIAPETIDRLISIQHEDYLIAPFIAYAVAFAASLHLSRNLQVLLLQREATIGLAIEWYGKLILLLLLHAFEKLTLDNILWVFALTAALGAVFMGYRLWSHLQVLIASSSGEMIAIDKEKIWHFGRNNYLQDISEVPLTDHAVKIFSASFLGLQATAIFGFAQTLAVILRRYLPYTLLLGLIEPTFMARYSQSKDFGYLNEMASIVLKVNLFLLAPAITWIALSGAPLIDSISGGKYTHATWLIACLLVLLALEGHREVLKLVANAADESWLLFSSNIWAISVVLIQILATMISGLPGLLVGMVLVSWFRNFYLVLRLRQRGYPYALGWPGLLRLAACALAAGGLGHALTQWIPGLLGAGLATVVVAGTFLTLTYIWKPFTPNERALLNRFLGRPIFVW